MPAYPYRKNRRGRWQDSSARKALTGEAAPGYQYRRDYIVQRALAGTTEGLVATHHGVRWFSTCVDAALDRLHLEQGNVEWCEEALNGAREDLAYAEALHERIVGGGS